MDNTRKENGRPRPPKFYSESFKRKVVSEYERGFMKKSELRIKYDIRGNGCLNRWLQKYGKLPYSTVHSIGRPMKDPAQQRIKELEAELAKKKLEVAMWKHAVELAEAEFNISIVKKSGAQQSKNLHKKNKG